MPGLVYGSELQKKNAERSFWNGYYSIPDPWEGLVFETESTQKTGTYAWLGAAPMPVEWVGDRKPKDANEYSYDVTDKNWDATISVDKDLIEYEQWDEVGRLVANLGMKVRAHRSKRLSTILEAGFSTVCEDGQYYFDTDHLDAGAEYTTTQDNDLTSAAATGTQPTAAEAATGIRSCFNAVYGFKDDRGDPMCPNEEIGNPANFIVMVPSAYLTVFRQVLVANTLSAAGDNDLKGTFTLRHNPFLTSSAIFYFFYRHPTHKPFGTRIKRGTMLEDNINSKSGNTDYSGGWKGECFYGQWRTAIGYTYT